MHYGTSFPLDHLEDVRALRAAAIRMDEAGLDFVTIGGHLLTAPSGRYPDRPATTYAQAYRDPFVLFSHLASATSHLRFRTNVLILPLFGTVVVAKQAAELAIVSENRFELGVAISWQRAEYQAAGQSFSNRGRRFEEQLVVLRRLWSEPIVSFAGEFHEIDEVGIGQLPSEPIPIWIGCSPLPELLARVARHGDGWLPLGPIDLAGPVRTLRELAGARAKSIGVTARVVAQADHAASLDEATRAVAAGATAIVVAPPPGATLHEGLDVVIAAHRYLVDVLGPGR